VRRWKPRILETSCCSTANSDARQEGDATEQEEEEEGIRGDPGRNDGRRVKETEEKCKKIDRRDKREEEHNKGKNKIKGGRRSEEKQK
jgi:hypothetical protein